ncbi:MAG: patatin-like phospholipase family protein, partial [Candidatus Marinimicrobia bacterium]|nr:patatin-like phospholipase family protein [Candidatus Neomarinimicrobiota bacterium]
SNEKMGKLIEEQLGKRNLEEGNIPIALIATDICSGEKVVMKTGSVADAVMASTCIPGVFTPVEINGRMLVDGGIVENVPISPLKEMGADVIIAVDLNAANKPRKPGNIVEVLLRTFDFLIQSISIVQKEKADIRIEPDLSEYNMVEIKQAPDLILEGYHAAMIVLRKTLRAK